MSQAEHIRLLRLEAKVEELSESLAQARKEVVRLWEMVSDLKKGRKVA